MRHPGKTEFVFYPEFRCNLRCSYCNWGKKEITYFGRKVEMGERLPWYSFLMHLERFRPYHLEVCGGGEPTLWEDLPKLIAHIPFDSTWAMTTNLLKLDINKYFPDRCMAVTGSFHHVKEEEFFEKILSLARKGFTGRITLVVTPDNIEDVDAIVNDRKRKFAFNIQPMWREGFKWTEHPIKWDMVKRICNGNRVKIVEYIPIGWDDKRFSKCRAGMDYVFLLGDGRVYRCATSLVYREPMGNIKDLKLDEEPQPCGELCVEACDREVEKYE